MMLKEPLVWPGRRLIITFPLFTELEKHRDEANENFHRNIRPQLVEWLKAFGFASISEDISLLTP